MKKGERPGSFFLNWKVPPEQLKKVEQMTGFIAEFNEPQPDCRKREVFKHFVTLQALVFVLKSNQAEGLGTQTFVSTIAALKKLVPSNTADKETRGYYAGMDWLDKEDKTRLEKPLSERKELTTWMLIEAHQNVLEGVATDQARIFRTQVDHQVAAPNLDDSFHQFPEASAVKYKLRAILHEYNSLLKDCPHLSTVEGVLFLTKLSCFLFFRLVSLHPFLDGNGRTCRLFANWVLGSAFPFPVPIWPDGSNMPNADELKTAKDWCSLRDKSISYYSYCQAIEKDRLYEQPIHLTIMTIDQAYKQFQSLLNMLAAPDTLN